MKIIIAKKHVTESKYENSFKRTVNVISTDPPLKD